MTIARITNQGKIKISDEIIEYPAELEGERNLLPINTVGRYSGGRISNTSQFNTDDPYTFETNGNPGNKIGFEGYNLIPERNMVLSAESDRVEDMKFSIGWYDSVGGYISHGDIGVNNTYIIGDRIFYSAKVPKDAYQISVGIGEFPFKTDYTIKKPQLILGNKTTDWTPAPEDLDLVYPDDIQYFSTGFRADGTMIALEFIEGEDFSFSSDKKMHLNELEEGVDFSG